MTSSTLEGSSTESVAPLGSEVIHSLSPDNMNSSTLKRASIESNPPAKKARTEPRLIIRPKLPEFSKLSLDNLIELSGDVKSKQLAYLDAMSLFQTFCPRHAHLQARFYEIRKADLTLCTEWHDKHVTDKKKSLLKLGTKMLANLARTMGDIREDTHKACNYAVAHAAALYEASAYASLISTHVHAPTALDSIPDIEARFAAVLEYLEGTQQRVKQVLEEQSTGVSTSTEATHTDISSAQTPNTTLAPPFDPLCNTAGLINTDPRSDDYLRQRAAQFEVKLGGNEILVWDRIYGVDNLKHLLNTIMYQIRYPLTFSDFERGIPGILLHGPNGTGKSSVVYSFAKHYKLPTFLISTAVKGSLQGETEKLITSIFNEAKAIQPCVLFIDEADGLLRNAGPVDSSVASAVAIIKQLWSDLLSESQRVFVFAATNAPWDIPISGFSRRFGHVEYVGLPDQSARHKILKSFLPATATVNNEQMEGLAKMTEGYTGSDIRAGISLACRTLVEECMAAKAWRKVHTSTDYILLPASLPSGSQGTTHDELAADQKDHVRPRNLNFTCLAEFFDPCSAKRQRKTVREEEVKSHKRWQLQSSGFDEAAP